MVRFALYALFLSIIFASCTEVTDCKCIIDDGQSKTESDYYDYEGDCSDLDDSEMECKAF